MRYKDYKLDAQGDSIKLKDLQNALSYDPRYNDVKKFLNGTSLDDIMADRTEEQQSWPSVSALIKQAMRSIAYSADMIVSTTHGSLEKLTKHFNKDIALVTILDEGGSVLQAEAMICWRNSRPLFVAGDVHQLPPAVLSRSRQKNIMVNDQKKSVPVNMFQLHALTSILEKLIKTEWPCFVLDEQLRICYGGFDLNKGLTYKDYNVLYTKHTELRGNPRYRYAPNMEPLLKRLDSTISASPEGKLWPIFIHCDQSQCVKSVESSRYNPMQADKLFKLMNFICKELSMSSKDALIITPYRAMQSYLRQRLQKLREENPSAKLADVQIVTSDSFQGHEAPVTFFVMTVTAESGPGFLCDQRRLNVSSSRHTEMLFVVGDIDLVTSPTTQTKARQPEVDEMQSLVSFPKRNEALFKFLHWFKTNRRVVRRF